MDRLKSESYSSMGLSGEERGYTEKRIRAGEKPAPTIKWMFVWECQDCDALYKRRKQAAECHSAPVVHKKVTL